MATTDNYQYSQQDQRPNPAYQERSYSSVLNDVISSGKDVLRSEINLFMTELKQLQPNLTKHIAQAAIFGGLLVISVVPFLAFLVIGLGEILDGRYWLSSLIVSILCAAIGGVCARRALVKIKNEDLKFSQTKRSIQEALQVTNITIDKVKTASKGNLYGSKSYN